MAATARKKAAGRISKRGVGPVSSLPASPAPYQPPDPEGARFLFSNDALVEGIRGPFGSGKSVLCVHKIMKRVQEMPAIEIKNGRGEVIDRVRRSRWAIVRNTFPELKLTTVNTWRDWVPDALGEFAWSAPFTHYLNYPMPDGTRIEAEIIFLAMDKPEDIKKLLSLDLTGCWINEAREIPKEIVDGATARIGRYPSPEMGGCPPEQKLLIMDTNSPGEEHWWPIMAGDVEPPEWMTEEERRLLVKPHNWRFFTQPPAMIETLDDTGRVSGYEINPDRANREVRDEQGNVVKKGLPDSYYSDMIAGKTRTWINVYVLNRYDTIVSGRRVYVEWSDELHVAPKIFDPDPAYAIHVGLDWGRTPAAVFLQYVRDRVLVFDEFVMAGVSTRTFGRGVAAHLMRRGWAAGQFVLAFHGDPSGDDLKETEDSAPAQIFRAATNYTVRPADTNDPLVRIEAVAALMTRNTVEGPCLTVSPRCLTLLAGFRGGYHYKQLGGRGSANYDNKPTKNRFSHPHDALQYGTIGCGAWRPVMQSGPPAKVYVAQRAGNPLQRLSRRSGVSRWSRA